MNFAEKILYHQIHPFKLATDVLASLFSLFFFWKHELLLGLLIHLVPPVAASFFLIYAVDLEPQRQSAFGRYVKQMMTRGVEAIRLGGDIVMVFGAWFHSLALISFGLLIVIGAWLSGLLRSKAPHAR